MYYLLALFSKKMSLKYRIRFFVYHQREIKFILLVLFVIFLVFFFAVTVPTDRFLGLWWEENCFPYRFKKYKDLHIISIQFSVTILHTTLKKYFDPVFGNYFTNSRVIFFYTMHTSPIRNDKECRYPTSPNTWKYVTSNRHNFFCNLVIYNIFQVSAINFQALYNNSQITTQNAVFKKTTTSSFLSIYIPLELYRYSDFINFTCVPYTVGKLSSSSPFLPNLIQFNPRDQW